MKDTLLNWQDNLTIREIEREVLFSICDSSIATKIHNYITITIQYYNIMYLLHVVVIYAVVVV